MKISGLGLRIAFLLITAWGVSLPAGAATISLNGDAWKLANNQSVYSVDGVTATAGPLSTLTYDAKGGLAVTYTTPGLQTSVVLEDESPSLLLPAGPVSALTLAFAASKPVNGFTVLQRVKASKGDLIGYYSVNGGAWQSLIVGNNGQGAFDVVLGQDVISTLAFAANPAFEQGFWVRSIDAAEAASVAEPTSLALIGVGLLFGAAHLRRRR